MTSRALRTGRTASLTAVLLSLLLPALVALSFAAAGIMHVTSRVLVVDMGYKLSTAEQQSRELTREHQRLKLELATLKSPTRLEKLAREQLQMVPASASAVLSLSAPVQRLGRSAPSPSEPGQRPFRSSDRGISP